ncbi:MAG: hypothetical protein Kow0063_16070 [Anaerolineae bacterium]
MIEQSNQLPLAEYLHLLELAQSLGLRLPEAISIESVENNIRRQLDISLPASHARAGFKSYQDLKLEEEALRQVLNTIKHEIQPLADRFTPGFVEDLQADYEQKWRAVQSKLELSERLDQEYRRGREQEGEAIARKKETLLAAHQHEVGLQSVIDLAEEIKNLEAREEESNKFRKRRAEEWAELAEAQIEVEKAKGYWEKALELDDSPALGDRRDRHLAVLEALEEKASCSYDDLLKEAKALFDGAVRAPLEALARPENDLWQASEMCRRIVEALASHPYPSSTRQEADRLMAHIKDYNDRMWHNRAMACMAQAEVELAGENLDGANQNLAYARQALALIWDRELEPSHQAKLEAIQHKIETKARQRTDGVIGHWRQQAQTHLDGKDAVAALNCIYAAKVLIDDTSTMDETIQALEALENQALALLSQKDRVEARSLAERASQFFSQGDSKSAFRWLEAALHLDATAILSEPGFAGLIDAFFELRSRRLRIESLLAQAQFTLAQDTPEPDTMLAAQKLLAEARQLAEEIGETNRLPEIEECQKALQQRHREALTEELHALLGKLEETQPDHGATPPDPAATLSVLRDLTHVLARIEQAKFTVDNVKPHLQRAFEYYAQLQSDTRFKDDLDSAEGYSLSYMLLSRVSNWESG